MAIHISNESMALYVKGIKIRANVFFYLNTLQENMQSAVTSPENIQLLVNGSH